MRKICVWMLLSVVFTGFSTLYGQSSASFLLKRWSISNGGGVGTSSSFHLKESAIGGIAVGAASSSSFVLNGGMLITTVEDTILAQTTLPRLFSLQQNYPNPFNPETTIEYSLPKQSEVTIQIFNTLGQLVKILVQGDQPPGQYRVLWDGKDNHGQRLSSGVYYYQIMAEGFKYVRKMLLLR